MSEKYAVPEGFGPAGAKLWADIAGGAYVLRPDELRVLEDACREADLVDELASAARDYPPLVEGSMGQLVLNPLISEMRQHRTTFATLMGKLKLPDDGDAAPRSTQARSAAQARWSKPA